MPDTVVLCRHFTHLHDLFKIQGDEIQKLIDAVIAELDNVLVGPYRTDFLDDMNKAQDTDARIAAAEAATARLLKNWRQLMKDFGTASSGGVPIDPWPLTAKLALEQLRALLRMLKALRGLEADMGSHMAAWCG